MADLLGLMGASQEDQTVDEARSGDEEPEEGCEGRGSFSQIWGTASMQAAMVQALSEFESATQKECQEILDCVNNGERYKDSHDREDLSEAAVQDVNLRGRMKDGGFPFRNFQPGDAGDDIHGLEVEPQRQRSAVVEPQNYSQEPTKVGAALEDNGIANVFESLQLGRTRNQRSTVIIPQADGPGDSDSEEEFTPEPKRMRMISKDNTRGSKKEESLRREEKEIPKGSCWGSLPMSVASTQHRIERQVIRTEGNGIKGKSDIKQDKCIGYLEHHKEEFSTILERRRVQSLEKRSCSEVSLRALMRKQRKRQPQRNEDSTPSSKALTESQSEGEQIRDQPRITVKPEVKTRESSAQRAPVLQEAIKRYQEREDMFQTSFEILKSGVLPDFDKGIELADNSSPLNNHIRKSLGSGMEEQLLGIVSSPKLDDEVEFVRKLQHSKNLEVKPKQEIRGQWGFNLLEGGDHRDSGGGGIPECAVLEVGNTGAYGCVEIPLEGRFSNEEVVDKNLSKEYADLYLASSIGLTNLDVDITERFKHSKDSTPVHIEDAQKGSEIAEGLCKKAGSPSGANRFAPEASKGMTKSSSAKQAIDEAESVITAAIGSTQLGEEGVGYVDSDTGISGFLVPSETKFKNKLIAKDQGISTVSFPRKRSSHSRAAVGLRMQSYPPTSEDPMLSQQRVGESKMLWKEKTARTSPLNTEKCKYAEDPIADRVMITTSIKAVPDVTYKGSEPNIKNDFIMKEDFTLGESASGEKDPAEDQKSEAFHKETTDNLGVVFTSMSDKSEDSFEWGFDFGSFYRSDDSDEGRQELSEDKIQWLPSVEVPSTVLNIREEVTSAFQVETRIKSNVSIDEEVVRQEDLPFRKKEVQASTFRKENVSEMFQKSMQATRPEAEPLSSPMTPAATYLDLPRGKETVLLSKGVYTGKGEEFLQVKFHQKPPSKEALLASLSQYGLKRVSYEGVVYGNSKDVPGRPTISAGLIFDSKLNLHPDE